MCYPDDLNAEENYPEEWISIFSYFLPIFTVILDDLSTYTYYPD